MRNNIRIITSIILTLVMLLSMFSLSSCKNEKDKDTKDKESIETETPESENKEPKETEEAKESKESSKDSETEESDIISTEPPVTFAEPIFEYNENGYIKGSLADYNSIVISVGGYEYTAKEYFDDYQKAINTWYDIVSENAEIAGITSSGLTAHYDKNEISANTLKFGATYCSIYYGREYGDTNDLGTLDFSINDIRLGDSINDAFEVFGETSGSELVEGSGSFYYRYYFENGSVIHLCVSNHTIRKIEISLYD